MSTFEDIGLSQELIAVTKRMGFTTPTMIQTKSIPHVISGKDVMGESATGSGKTLAFGCGIIEKCEPNQGLQALILTPTRELAEQVKEEIKKFSQHKKLKVMSVYGGVAMEPQVRSLTTANVVVATPGRLLDHMQRHTIDMRKIRLLVIDEADRMFDMGFIDDVERIVRACPKDRQSLFFSATLSTQVKDLAKRYTKNPIVVTATRMVDPSKLKQVYYDVSSNMKLSLLGHLLEHEESGLVMVFCNTRHSTDFVVKNLKVNKINAIAIHGGYSQNKRTKTISLFSDAKVGVMVCTDVAARGLHIDDVSHIYNYEIPNDPNDYVHRIGRTARAGENGKVINLICDRDYDNFGRVVNEYRDFKIDKIDRPQVEKLMATRVDRERKPFRRSGGSGGRGRPQQGGRPRGPRSGSPSRYRGGQGSRGRPSQSGGRSGGNRGGPRVRHS